MKAELDRRVEEGLVSARTDGDLTLYAYSPSCVGLRAWDEFTRAARGLVLRADGTVAARPWPKFFNLGEQPETQVANLPREVPEVSEKADGSLIVVFHDGARWRAVTRGAWDSPQARWAQAWLASTAPVASMDPSLTWLFELVAPWNRVVLRYEREELLLLGRVETATGRDESYADAAAEAARLGLRTPPFHRGRVEEFDPADPAARGVEGFVARYSNGLRVKLKYAAYLALHRIVTGSTPRTVWERLRAGEPAFPEDLPDEFLGWYEGVRDAILARRAALEAEIEAAWNATDRSRTRKGIAESWARLGGPVKAALFRRLDGRSNEELLWKAVYPEGGEGWFGGGR